jgi:hypothetical protein
MSGSTTPGTSRPGGTVAVARTARADDPERWAALDQQNERLVDFSHPLMAELRRDHPELGRSLQAAS